MSPILSDPHTKSTSKRITIDPITRLEGHGKIEIFLLVFRPGPDFEDYGDHFQFSLAAFAMTYNVTLRKKLRSSARMNLFSSAKSKLAMPSASARSRAR